MDQSQSRDATFGPEASRPKETRQQRDDEFRLLVDQVTEYAIFRLDPDGRVVSWNAGAERIKGYRTEEILGCHFSLFYVAEDVRRGLPGEVLSRAQRTGQWIAEGWRLRRGGSRFWAYVTITSLYDENGELYGYAKVTRDMTEQHDREAKLREREAELKESEAKFRTLAENTQVGIGLLQDGCMQYVNPAHARMFGYRPEELIGEPPTKFIHPDARTHVETQIRRRLDRLVPHVQYEFKGLTKKGAVRRIEVHGSRIRYNGRPALIASLLDVTERRRLQREVLRVQEEERRRFGQDLHDGVASQLTGIGIMLGVLARRDDLSRDAARGVSEIRELVDESCQDVRRLSRGLAPAGLSGKELPSALERLAENIEGGHFSRDTSDLQKLSEATAAHLYWIAQEATTNARKYAKADEVVIRFLQEDSALVLEVEDDGRGFDPENVAMDGLGLRTMRYRADLLGATFTLDSNPGEGTCVRCRLPV